MQSEKKLLELLNTAPESIEFADVMSTIDEFYSYTPTGFSCGNAVSEAGSNEGSCKILAFGKLNGLSAEQTLALFGRFYREDVLQHPEGDDHGNIRNFMQVGWNGVSFDNEPLVVK